MQNRQCKNFNHFSSAETYQTVVKSIQFKWLHGSVTETRAQLQARVIQTLINSYLILNILPKRFYYKTPFKSIDVYHKCAFAHVLTSKYGTCLVFQMK